MAPEILTENSLKIIWEIVLFVCLFVCLSPARECFPVSLVHVR